jgi:hypothetical protein
MRVEEKERYHKVRRVAVARKKQVDHKIRESKAKQDAVKNSILESRKRFQLVLGCIQKKSKSEATPRVSLDHVALAYQNLLEIKQEGEELGEIALALVEEQRPLLVESQRSETLVSALDDKIEAIQLEQDEQVEAGIQEELVELQSAQRSLESTVDTVVEKPIAEEVRWNRVADEQPQGQENPGEGQLQGESSHAVAEFTQLADMRDREVEKLQQDIGDLQGVHNVQILSDGDGQQLSFDFETKAGGFLSVRLETFAGSKLRVVVFTPGLSNVKRMQTIAELKNVLSQKGFNEVTVHFIGRLA